MELTVRSFVLLFFAALSTRVEADEFVEEPRSVNVTMGSTVSFNCTAAEVPEDQYWKVNGKTLNYPDNSNRGITTHSTDNELTFIATVPAIFTNDDITVQCVLLTPSLVLFSQQARLRIQGLLSAVSDINTEQINGSSIIVSFSAPPSLLGVPINHYSIVISSADLLTNHSLITNSTMEILHFPDACIKYWITISAWNDVGQGALSTSSVILATSPGKPSVVIDQKYVFDAQMETILIVTNDFSCLGSAPEYFIAKIQTESLIVLTIGQCPFNNISNTSCGTSQFQEEKLTLLLNLSEYLQLNHMYLGQIEMYNSAGVASTDIEIVTFDVSSAALVMYKDSYCVICEFVEGSKCQGCKIDIVKARTTTQLVTFSAPRFNDAKSVTQCINIDQFPSGEYTVYVSDIESDGSYSDTAKTLAFQVYNSEPNDTTATPTAMYQPLNSINITLTMLIIVGAFCGLTLIVMAILVSCLLRSKMKKKQNLRHVQENLEPKVTQPEPTYENAQEIILVENVNKIWTENCVAYASMTRQ